MLPSEQVVTVEIADGLATLRLNWPGAGNAINLETARALADAAAVVDSRRDIRCVLLTGSGRFFCVGGDLVAFDEADDGAGMLMTAVTHALHAAISRLARMEKPLVVAVNGPAAGAGIGLAALGDIVISAKSAHFSMAYTAVGLTPDGGATALLPRLIGLRRTQELLLTNRRVSASEAAEMGLVTHAVDDNDLEVAAADAVSRLIHGPTAALGAIRRLLLSELKLEAHLELEARAIAQAVGGGEGREGVRAFLEKRAPVFTDCEGRK